jgi:hypothetical protein
LRDNVRETVKAKRDFEGVADREADGLFKLSEIDHGRAAVEAEADVSVLDVAGVAGGAREPELVGILLARRRVGPSL